MILESFMIDQMYCSFHFRASLSVIDAFEGGLLSYTASLMARYMSHSWTKFCIFVWSPVKGVSQFSLYSFLELEFVVGVVVDVVCPMSVSVVLPTEFVQVVSVSKGLPLSSFEFGFWVWFQECKQTASTSFGSYFFYYVFNYPKIKTDISSSIVHSEFKYPTEFSCIKSLSEE